MLNEVNEVNKKFLLSLSSAERMILYDDYKDVCWAFNLNNLSYDDYLNNIEFEKHCNNYHIVSCLYANIDKLHKVNNNHL